jgi:hypothetical protein
VCSWIPINLTQECINQYCEVALSHLQWFKEIKTSVWNPEWQVMRNGWTISLLKQKKLEYNGNMQLLWQSKIQHVSVCWKSYGICISEMKKKSSMLHSCTDTNNQCKSLLWYAVMTVCS